MFVNRLLCLGYRHLVDITMCFICHKSNCVATTHYVIQFLYLYPAYFSYYVQLLVPRLFQLLCSIPIYLFGCICYFAPSGLSQ